jgi:hypothetical protein
MNINSLEPRFEVHAINQRAKLHSTHAADITVIGLQYVAKLQASVNLYRVSQLGMFLKFAATADHMNPG